MSAFDDRREIGFHFIFAMLNLLDSNLTDWLHLTGFVHDLGKIMNFWGEPQWSTVGDTFVVGCEFAPSIVYRETTFKNNPDLRNPLYK